jgi:hypothetical protein
VSRLGLKVWGDSSPAAVEEVGGGLLAVRRGCEAAVAPSRPRAAGGAEEDDEVASLTTTVRLRGEAGWRCRELDEAGRRGHTLTVTLTVMAYSKYGSRFIPTPILTPPTSHQRLRGGGNQTRQPRRPELGRSKPLVQGSMAILMPSLDPDVKAVRLLVQR